MVKLTEEQTDNLNRLKEFSEKTLYQEIDETGGGDANGLVVLTDLNDVKDGTIVAVYNLVGFRRVQTTRTLQTVK